MGEEFMRAAFESHTRIASLIHFHGHCMTDTDNILDQSLKSSRGKAEFGDATDGGQFTSPTSDTDTGYRHRYHLLSLH
jgi:hypothetical protein